MKARVCRKGSSGKSRIASLLTKPKAKKGCTCDGQRRVKFWDLQQLDDGMPEDFANCPREKKP